MVNWIITGNKKIDIKREDIQIPDEIKPKFKPSKIEKKKVTEDKSKKTQKKRRIPQHGRNQIGGVFVR